MIYHPFLESLKQKGISLGLERVYNALEEIGSPQEHLKGALIAGTNGKGSTATILYNLLYSHGIKTALYTSPHIMEINDRYTINNRHISDEQLSLYIDDLKGLATRYDLTLFEFETLLAFKYFYDSKVELFVCEVGMGGRLDATNCFNPDIKIITSISKDHTEYLGETEREILLEKAGIIKSGNNIITGIDSQGLIEVLRSITSKTLSTLKIINQDFFVEDIREEGDYEVFNYRYRDYQLGDIKLSLFGRHQVNNCSLAITSFIDIMESSKRLINRDLLLKTFKDIRFRGRFDIYSKEPLIIIDGAHNIDGIKKLKRSLIDFNRNYNKKILVIFSSLTNKDPLSKIRELSDIAERFIFVENSHPLSVRGDEFIGLGRKAGLNYYEVMDIKSAVKKIFNEYNDRLILFTGSLYTLKDIYTELGRHLKNG